jgi:hypothetical protein
MLPDLEINHLARHQWLTPIIFASQEADIRRLSI